MEYDDAELVQSLLSTCGATEPYLRENVSKQLIQRIRSFQSPATGNSLLMLLVLQPESIDCLRSLVLFLLHYESVLASTRSPQLTQGGGPSPAAVAMRRSAKDQVDFARRTGQLPAWFVALPSNQRLFFDPNNSGDTLAHFLVSAGHCDLLRLCFGSCLHRVMSLQNSHGMSPMMIASSLGRLHIVSYVCSQLAASLPSFLNDQSSETQRTALHMGVVNGHLDCVRCLLGTGAVNETLRDREGNSASDLAAFGPNRAGLAEMHDDGEQLSVWQGIADLLNPPVDGLAESRQAGDLSGGGDINCMSSIIISGGSSGGGVRFQHRFSSERVLLSGSEWAADLAPPDHVLSLTLSDDVVSGKVPLDELSASQLDGLQVLLAHLTARVHDARSRLSPS